MWVPTAAFGLAGTDGGVVGVRAVGRSKAMGGVLAVSFLLWLSRRCCWLWVTLASFSCEVRQRSWRRGCLWRCLGELVFLAASVLPTKLELPVP